MATSRSRNGRGSERPHVICHMVPSVDGRIVVDGWRLPDGLTAESERTAASFDADAWIEERRRAGAAVGDRRDEHAQLVHENLRLLSAERRRGDLLWVRYRVRDGRS